MISSNTESIAYARVAQLVERDLAKVEAAGSSPVSRSENLLNYQEVFYLQKISPGEACITMVM